MNANRQASVLRRAQSGLTLVELLVGLTLGLIITTALLLLFANSSANGQNLARSGLQIESGRYVSELLREDLRLAGFYGEISVSGSGATYPDPDPDPCDTTSSGWSGSPVTFPAPVHGYTGVQANEAPADCLPNHKPGTAAIAVRRLSLDTVDPVGIPTGNTQYYVQYSFCNSDLTSPQLIFSVDKAAFTLRNRACSAANTVRAYVQRIYYVAGCNRCDPSDEVPTLKRVDLVGNTWVPTALADGIDDLQFEYGFDTTAAPGDGSADTYLAALGSTGPTARWENVMTVKVHFITRSLDKVLGDQLVATQDFDMGSAGTVTTAADGYTRRVYSNVIRLVNPGGARDIQ